MDGHNTRVFLAGSIEMGTAELWQEKVVNAFKFNVTFLNPRRDDWDSSWEQDLNNPNFYEQVTWELNHLEKSDYVIFYFDPNTKSPITLLELGLMIGEHGGNKILVCCPHGYWRKGNVDIICQRYGVPMFENLDTMIVALKIKIKIKDT